MRTASAAAARIPGLDEACIARLHEDLAALAGEGEATLAEIAGEATRSLSRSTGGAPCGSWGVIGVISLLTGRSPLYRGLLLLAAAIVVAPFAVLAWMRFTYRVAGRCLEGRSGVLTRALRTIRSSGSAACRVGAPPHYLAGLVQVRVDDAAGGTSASGLRLAAVRGRDAEALREAVLALRAAAGPRRGRAPARVAAEGAPAVLAVAGATSGRYLLVPVAALAAARKRSATPTSAGWRTSPPG